MEIVADRLSSAGIRLGSSAAGQPYTSSIYHVKYVHFNLLGDQRGHQAIRFRGNHDVGPLGLGFPRPAGESMSTGQTLVR